MASGAQSRTQTVDSTCVAYYLGASNLSPSAALHRNGRPVDNYRGWRRVRVDVRGDRHRPKPQTRPRISLGRAPGSLLSPSVHLGRQHSHVGTDGNMAVAVRSRCFFERLEFRL